MTMTTTKNAASADVAAELETRINMINAEVQRRIVLESSRATPKSNARRLRDLVRVYVQAK